jgi:hypothetical protein
MRPTRGGKLVARRLIVAKGAALSFDYLRDLKGSPVGWRRLGPVAGRLDILTCGPQSMRDLRARNSRVFTQSEPYAPSSPAGCSARQPAIHTNRATIP